MAEMAKEVRELEWRLKEHFEALNDAIDARDKFALGATWGIVKASCVIAAFLVASGIDKWLEWPWWASFAIFVTIFLVVCFWGAGYAERAEAKDKEKLRPLPKWRSD